MTTAEQVVRELAAISLRELGELEPPRGRGEPAASMFDRLRDLVLSARCVEAPRERPADQADANDYAAVVQLAVVLTHDGRLMTSRRSDAPPHALAPMLGALGHEVEKLTRALARESGLPPEDFRALVATMTTEAAEADFRRAALQIEPGSRSVQHPTVTESPG